VLGIVNGEIVKVTDESVQKETDINTEVFGIVNSEIVNVTDESVQKKIDINTEVLLLLLFHYYLSLTLLY
jgi:predicted acetyltransferase